MDKPNTESGEGIVVFCKTTTGEGELRGIQLVATCNRTTRCHKVTLQCPGCYLSGCSGDLGLLAKSGGKRAERGAQ